MAKYAYFFGAGKAEGSARMRDLLGGKGCDLAEMTNLGLPVPPGFTITTEACAEYLGRDKRHAGGMWEEVVENLRRLEAASDLRFGDPAGPLLVSVRSGARVSMPGMMDTVLNLGLNDATVAGLARRTRNDRFAWDCYRRFVMMFGDVVLGLERSAFERLLDETKARVGAKSDPEVPAEALMDLVGRYKTLVREKTGEAFPPDPLEQLRLAIDAVFNSWNSQRAATYRKIHGIPPHGGTAVSVMAMVFGNLGEGSGAGVAFTRDPATGERRFVGEFLMNAQGEDVVAGFRTPEPITSLPARAPKVYEELLAIKDRLERHYRDMQDIEFTIQEGRLFLLQTRSGKRTAKAAVRMAVEMVREGLIDKQTALLRLEPHRLHELLHFIFDPTDKARAIGEGRLLAKGLPAGPGAAVGRVVFNADRAVEWARSGEKVLLVRPETSPEDVAGMWAGEGILTSRGGLTSHAAVVARGMGKCCIVGAGDILVDEERRVFQAGRTLVREGDLISIDGHTGEILLDAVPRIRQPISEELRVFLKWADEARTLGVPADADSSAPSTRASMPFGTRDSE